MEDIKQIQESIIIRNFRKHFPGFPKGKLIKSESPDFILKTSPRHSIGIELTSFPSASYRITKDSMPLFLTGLQTSISKKEEKLKSYRKQLADKYWLIIYADNIIAQGIHLNNHLEKITVSSEFDRVFLFDLFEGTIRELKNEK